MNKPAQIKLAHTLALLYEDEDKARYIIDFTTMNPGMIDFSGASLHMWTRILREAGKNENTTAEIVSIAYKEYPSNELIQLAFNEIVLGKKTNEPVEKSEVPFKNIIKQINKDRFGEIRRVDCNRSEQVKQYYKSMGSSCTITFAIGNDKDKPNSFAERIMLETLNDSKDIDTGEHNCWLYRNSSNNRVDEIPFKLRPVIDLSKNNFCMSMEKLFPGLDMDRATEYFKKQAFRNFSLSLNYDYAIGDEILEPFAAWIYNTFSGIKETHFQIFFILQNFQSIEFIQKKVDQIIKSLDSVPIVPIDVSYPIGSSDIKTWYRHNNLEFVQDKFLATLSSLTVSEEEINEFKNTEKTSMQVMEKFQNSIYDAFIKSQ